MFPKKGKGFPGTGGTSGDASHPLNGYGPASFETPHRIVGNFVWQPRSFRSPQALSGPYTRRKKMSPSGVRRTF